MPYQSVFRPGLFRDQVVIVTGAGSGIGRCTAHELAALGAARRARRPQARQARAVEAEIRADGGRCEHAVCDIRDEAAVQAARRGRGRGATAGSTASSTTPAASSPRRSPEISAKGWQAVVSTNLTGGFLMARECYLQSMRASGGAIVNMVADIWNGMPGMGHSGAARAGMLNFTETAACEWAPVRVNAVAPGWIASSGLDTYPSAMQAMIRGLPRHTSGAPPRHRVRGLGGDRVPALGGGGLHLRQLPAHRRRGAERAPALAAAGRHSIARLRRLPPRPPAARARRLTVPAFESQLATGSAAFAENRAHMLALLAELRRARGARRGGLREVRPALRQAQPAAATRTPRAAARCRRAVPRAVAARRLPARRRRSGTVGAGRRLHRRHRQRRRHALHGGRRRLRHRGRRAAAHGAREVPARAAARARQPAAVRAPRRIGRRQPAALPGRGLHQRRRALLPPRAPLGGRHPGAHARARQLDGGRRLHAGPVGLRRDGAQPRPRVPRRPAAAQGGDRRDRDRGGPRRGRDARDRVGARRVRRRGRCRGPRHPARARRPPRLARRRGAVAGRAGAALRRRRAARHHAARRPQAGRHARGDRPPGRRLGVPRVQVRATAPAPSACMPTCAASRWGS